jgi:hypothetical protein
MIFSSNPSPLRVILLFLKKISVYPDIYNPLISDSPISKPRKGIWFMIALGYKGVYWSCCDSTRYRETSFVGFLVGPPPLFDSGFSYLNAKTYSWMP